MSGKWPGSVGSYFRRGQPDNQFAVPASALGHATAATPLASQANPLDRAAWEERRSDLNSRSAIQEDQGRVSIHRPVSLHRSPEWCPRFVQPNREGTGLRQRSNIRLGHWAPMFELLAKAAR